MVAAAAARGGREGAATSGAGLGARRGAKTALLAAPRGTHCVDASSKPSGLYAAAIVDRGGGCSTQYEALQRRSESASAQPRRPAATSPGATTDAGRRPDVQCRAEPSSRAASNANTELCRQGAGSPMARTAARRAGRPRRRRGHTPPRSRRTRRYGSGRGAPLLRSALSGLCRLAAPRRTERPRVDASARRRVRNTARFTLRKPELRSHATE